jgi:predicted RNase H-like nuclease (RuvC/YqgF family)
MFACQNVKEDPEYIKLLAMNDSLEAISNTDEKQIHKYLADFNDIQENLNRIKEMENVISLQTTNPSEMQDSAKDRINEDVNMIYELLLKNRATIEEMKRKLGKSDKKMRELEKMIDNLQFQIEEKDKEITALKEQLASMNIHIEILVTKVDSLSQENKVKESEIADKTEEINTVYYVYGTLKELTEKQIMTKEGGFIGIGKIEKLRQDFNKDYFTKGDLREIKSIPLSSKKARFATNHPSGSYKFVGNDKVVEKLEILDEKKFWSTSKYMVIVVE